MRPRALALTIAAAAASAVTVALVRLKRPRAAGAAVRRLTRPGPAGGALLGRKRRRAGGAGRAAAPEPYRCACGEEFRVSGTGRHRVHWVAGAADDDPVLSGRCPSCDRPLGPGPAEAVPAGT